MNMGVDEPWENSRGGVLGHLPGLVGVNVPGLDADDLFLIEKYGRWSFAELSREHPRASDGHHQHVILRGPSPVNTYLIFSRLPRLLEAPATCPDQGQRPECQ